jgi:methylenetetrahydrofolate--tRNA-(uracil-5-)-methyltransferase
LKEELRKLGSIVISKADEAAIPGGKALVVDRGRFATAITEEIEAHSLINVVREEIKDIPEGLVIFATGPLTSSDLVQGLCELTGTENLYFFDAISPIVDGETINMRNAFFGARYLEGNDDYLNCPLTKDEYDVFYDALIGAERVRLRDFENTRYFEGCLPVEIMAERGRQTLLYGPMKPVGLVDASTGKEPYAVMQLRREDRSGTMYNMVGFQTKLTYVEQDRVFRLIPGLKNAQFLRYGSVHRNTYIKSPSVLDDNLRLVNNKCLFFAGQITGVEGYVESVAIGLLAGISAYLSSKGWDFSPPPRQTCVGALLHYITTENTHFQPMNVNFGLLSGYTKKHKDIVAKNALSAIADWKQSIDMLDAQVPGGSKSNGGAPWIR